MRYLLLAVLICFCIPVFAIITPIANIQDSTTFYNNKTVTVQGTITIGAKRLHATQLKAYIQDGSGKGINLFNNSISSQMESDLIRGNVVKVTGTVTEFSGVTEIKNPVINEVITQGEPIPVIPMTFPQVANYTAYEGTMVKVSGTLYEAPYGTGSPITGYNVNIQDEANNRLCVRVWNTTGIDVSTLSAGTPITAFGVISPYNSASQLLPGYPEDIQIALTNPVISNITWNPVEPYLDEIIDIKAKIIDYNGTIVNPLLHYRLETAAAYDTANTIAMTSAANHFYTATLPAINTITSDKDNYIVFVSAKDNEGNFVESAEMKINVFERAPKIMNIRLVNQPLAGDSLIVQAKIIDTDGYVTSADILYNVNYANTQNHVAMHKTLADTTIWQGSIHGFGSGTLLVLRITAQDDSGLVSISTNDTSYVYPVKTHAAILQIPPKPFNPYNGDSIEIGYFAKAGDKAILRIYNAEGKLVSTPVNTIISSSNLSGTNFYKWNGLDSDYHKVQPGLYIIHFEVVEVATGNKKTAKAPIVVGVPLK